MALAATGGQYGKLSVHRFGRLGPFCFAEMRRLLHWKFISEAYMYEMMHRETIQLLKYKVLKADEVDLV